MCCLIAVYIYIVCCLESDHIFTVFCVLCHCRFSSFYSFQLCSVLLLSYVNVYVVSLVCVHVFTVYVLVHDCRRILTFIMSCASALTFTVFVPKLCHCRFVLKFIFFHVLRQCPCFYCLCILCHCRFVLMLNICYMPCFCSCLFCPCVLCRCFVFLCSCLCFSLRVSCQFRRLYCLCVVHHCHQFLLMFTVYGILCFFQCSQFMFLSSVCTTCHCCLAFLCLLAG